MDRQPEFTQLDLEMAFVDEKQVMTTVENIVRNTCRDLDVMLPDTFPTYRYNDVMDQYGSDKPDLRNPLKLGNHYHLVKAVASKCLQIQPVKTSTWLRLKRLLHKSII